MNIESIKPTKKMTAVGGAGAVAFLVVAALDAYTALELGAAGVQAITVLIVFAAGWLKSES
jgi:hypothetical protein